MRLSSIALASVVGGGFTISSSSSHATTANTNDNGSRENVLQNSNGKANRVRSFRKLASTNKHRFRLLMQAQEKLRSQDEDGLTSFEVCQLSAPPPLEDAREDVTDIDIGILESNARMLARGGCSSDKDICILPNVIGFDGQLSYAADEKDDLTDVVSSMATGICYPMESMHESYWRNRIPDFGRNEKEKTTDRNYLRKMVEEKSPASRFGRKRSAFFGAAHENLLRDGPTMEESYMDGCAAQCFGYEMPQVAHILASQSRRQRSLLAEGGQQWNHDDDDYVGGI